MGGGSTSGGVGPATEIRLFGGLRVVRDDGHEVDLGSRKQRMVLLTLALRPNDLVTADELIDALWGEHPPKAALTSLRSYLSNLRKALTDASIADIAVATRSPGYVLEVAAHQIDVERFRGQAGSGTPAEVDQALRLAERPIVPEFIGEEVAQPVVREVEQRTFELRRRRLERALAEGEHAARLPEIERLVEQHPLDEHLRGLQMLALYRSGRQADALASYADARERLLEELGLDPSPELQRLEQQVLAQDPELVLAPRRDEPVRPTDRGDAPASAEVQRRPTIGRVAELAALDTAAAQARQRKGRIVVVRGAPGLGKSHLIAAFTDQLLDAEVVWGRCTDAEAVPALWPWLEIGARLAIDLPATSTATSTEAQFAFHRDLLRALAAPGADRFRVIVVEDLHWIDESSALLLRHVAERVDDVGALLVITTRDTTTDPIRELLADLSRLPATETLTLGPLAANQVEQLVEASLGRQLELEALHHLTERSGGNPLFALQLARSGDHERKGETALPDDLAHALQRQLAVLDADDRRLCELASCCAGTIQPELLARVLESPVDLVVDGLERAVDAGLARYDDADPLLYRFGHVLLRDALYDTIAPRARMRLHAQLGVAMIEDPSAVGGDGAEIARHLALGARAGVATEALHWNREAGRRALARADHPNALLLMRRAAKLAEAHGAPNEERWEILLHRGVAARNQADVDEARDSLLAAFRLAESMGDPERMARAALELSDGTGSSRVRMWWREGDLALDALREARHHVANAPESNPLLLIELEAVIAADDIERPLEERARQGADLLQQAIDLGDTELIIRVEILCWLLQARIVPPSEALARADAAIARARDGRLVEAEFVLRRLALLAAIEAGDAHDVEARVASSRNRAELLGISPVTEATRGTLPMWRGMCGDLETAGEIYRRDIAASESLGPYAVQNHLLGELVITYWQNAALDGDKLGAATLSPTGPPKHLIAGIAMAMGFLGDLDACRGLIDMVGTADLVAPENLMVGNLTAACAGAALADVGTDAECQMAYDALLPFRGRIGTAGPALILGAQVDTSLARLARRLGRPDDARIHVDEALALATSLGASLLRLLAEIAEAELHAETGDIEAARARIEATERDAIDVGAKLIAAFATRTREAL